MREITTVLALGHRSSPRQIEGLLRSHERLSAAPASRRGVGGGRLSHGPQSDAPVETVVINDVVLTDRLSDRTRSASDAATPALTRHVVPRAELPGHGR